MSFVAIAALFFMFSCGGGSGSSPADVTKDILKKIEKADYDGAIKLIAMEGKELDEESKAKLTGLLAMGNSEVAKKEGISSLEVVSEEIDDDNGTAKVELKIVYGNGEEDNENYKLIKEDGSWKLKM